MSVGHSATYSLPRLIDHNQIWSDPCKPFWIPYLPYFGARGKNMQNSTYFQHVDSGYSCHCERGASCHMTCNKYQLYQFRLAFSRLVCLFVTSLSRPMLSVYRLSQSISFPINGCVSSLLVAQLQYYLRRRRFADN